MSQRTTQVPSVGRIVHYVSRGSPDGVFKPEHRAAIITLVYGTWDDRADTDHAGLCILNPSGMYFESDLPYDPDCAPGSWHWPEYVAPIVDELPE